MFLPDGRPVRARLTVTFNEFIDAEREAKEINRQTANFSKVHVVVQGETLSSIAGRLYDNPLTWRPIAIVNGIADPRSTRRRAGPSGAVAAVRRPGEWGGDGLTWHAIRNTPPISEIKINDEEMPAGVRAAVTNVRYQDGHQAADRVEIGIANPNLRWLQRHIRGLGFQPFPTGVKIGPVRVANAAPDGTFDLDNKLSLAIGYAPDPLEEMFLGEVTGVQVSFPNGGMPTMTVVAHDYLNRLSRGQYARGFGPLADALVVMILSAENLLIPLIDPTITAISTAMTVL